MNLKRPLNAITYQFEYKNKVDSKNQHNAAIFISDGLRADNFKSFSLLSNLLLLQPPQVSQHRDLTGQTNKHESKLEIAIYRILKSQLGKKSAKVCN